ncbi:uncharacterized protein SAPINGB_P005947 [Magnusiomyces paraingens]|uniref:THIF-type NAD/FAD binding fold domain-containing protein n=1 Tax=Magnusiomyces paraingens TaxID=2606893 RepID=A0A5E8C4G5_9ASCO|nr:uncharacterized protein SAPINGB_P005947 [Saprochaete ingens]VVT57920.1 unnamed protein product [Saprochaete ingens]
MGLTSFINNAKLSPATIALIAGAAASTLSVLLTLAIQAQAQQIKREELEHELKSLERHHQIVPVQLDEYGVPVSLTAEKSQLENGSSSTSSDAPSRIPLFGEHTASPASTPSPAPAPAPVASLSAEKFDTTLIDEQLARNRVFLGEEGYEKVRGTFVVIIGAGGVGSWAATMLVRSGIRKLRIIDFDQVTLSSLNRHATATLADVGRPKVHCIAEYLRKVAPWCEIEPVVALWDKKNTNHESLLSDGNPDWIVDAIDNIDTKVDLLEYCYKNLMDLDEIEREQNGTVKQKLVKKQEMRERKRGIYKEKEPKDQQQQDENPVKKPVRVISAMGAGAKSDPTRVSIGDISVSLEDPLARSTRRRLKQRKVNYGIPVVFSTEKPSPEKAALLPLSEEAQDQGNTEELAVLADFRVRILPVLGPLPAIFGLTIATHVLTLTGGYPGVTDPLQGGYSLAGKRRTKLYDSVLQSLAGQMARLKWDAVPVPVDMSDVEYLVEEVFRGKSVLSGQSTRLALTMWEPPKQKGVAEFSNLVIMTKDEQKKHESEVLFKGLSPKDVYSAEVLELVEKRFSEERYYSQFR